MTRILALTLYYPPHHHGGYEIACQTALRRLHARGHDIRVLTTDHHVDRAGADDSPFPVDRSLRCYIEDDELLNPGLRDRWRTERQNQARLTENLEDFRPEVVSVWHMGAMSLGLLTSIADRDVPMVLVIADDWLCYGIELDPWSRLFVHRSGLGALRPLIGHLARPLLRVPTVVGDLGESGVFLFTSESTFQRAREKSRWRFPLSAVSYLGIDTTAFTDRIETESSWSGHLLYAGRYDARKGLATVLEALAHLPSADLEVRGTGAGDHQQELHTYADRLGVAHRVDWADPLPQRELAERMAAADAVIFPSVWPEPFGLVPLEAMAVGTPVVATGVGGSGEFLVDGWNCLRFEPSHGDGLVAALRRLEAEPELRRRIVDGGHETADYFDAERFADVVERWHVAAADGFSQVRPDGRNFRRDVVTR